MNREILFRAKKTDNGEWIEGYFYKIWNDCYIMWGMSNTMPNMIKILPDTICQYTGLTDKNGRKIWENDIVMFTDDFAAIKWNNERARFTIYFRNNERYDLDNTWGVSLKSVSNIFDNPELLEV